jgi:cytochrome oxidase assembly protein ShyY1
MKIRTGFVSNSSSSSFVIMKSDITDYQEIMVKNYQKFAPLFGCDEYIDDTWFIDDHEDRIELETSMDNFDMDEYLDKIGVKH